MYSIDASALVDGWRRYYPPDVLPSLWENLSRLIEEEKIRATEEVKFELERGDDGLYRWCCEREGFFVPPGPEVFENVREIVSRFPNAVPARVHDGIWADPYVIALAEARDWIVVTGEKRTGDGETPKIPNICDALGVCSIDLLGLLREEKLSF